MNDTNRVFLLCGIIPRSTFAYVNTTESSFDEEDEKLRGYYVDFYKAVSAAIFDGNTDTTQFFVVDSPANLFLALANGDIDSTNKTGCLLTPPIFYDGLTYGSLQRHVQNNCS